MLDWKTISNDPNNKDAAAAVSSYLFSVSKTYPGKIQELVVNHCMGKKMLDIGAGEHDPSYFNDYWEHAVYKQYCSSIVAIEIDPKLCDFYNQKGFDFRCVDATSDVNLGEKFDFIYCGDVIEHVENTASFIRFVDRHLEQGGRCMVTTPNPFFDGYLASARKDQQFYHISNLEHLGWICPSQMLEILRRSGTGLVFDAIYVPLDAFEMSNRCLTSVEKYFSTYVYVLRKE